jgi:hypothetical protein
VILTLNDKSTAVAEAHRLFAGQRTAEFAMNTVISVEEHRDRRLLPTWNSRRTSPTSPSSPKVPSSPTSSKPSSDPRVGAAERDHDVAELGQESSG